jgi:hypothetical protein
MTKKQAAARQRRKAGERLRTYSTRFPTDGTGHSYHLKDIPLTTWEAALERARVDQVSIRAVLLNFLTDYADRADARTLDHPKGSAT